MKEYQEIVTSYFDLILDDNNRIRELDKKKDIGFFVERLVTGMESKAINDYAKEQQAAEIISNTLLAMIEYLFEFSILDNNQENTIALKNTAEMLKALIGKKIYISGKPITIDSEHIYKAVSEMKVAEEDEENKQLKSKLLLRLTPQIQCLAVMRSIIQLNAFKDKEFRELLAGKLIRHNDDINPVLDNLAENIPSVYVADFLKTEVGKLPTILYSEPFHSKNIGKKFIEKLLEKGKLSYNVGTLPLLSEAQLAKALRNVIKSAKNNEIDEIFSNLKDRIQKKPSDTIITAIYNEISQLEIDYWQAQDPDEQAKIDKDGDNFRKKFYALFDTLSIDKRIAWLNAMPIDINATKMIRALKKEPLLEDDQYIPLAQRNFLSDYLSEKKSQLEKRQEFLKTVLDLSQFILQLAKQQPKIIQHLDMLLADSEDEDRQAIIYCFHTAIKNPKTSLADAKTLLKLIGKPITDEYSEKTLIDAMKQILDDYQLPISTQQTLEQRSYSLIASLEKDEQKQELYKHFHNRSIILKGERLAELKYNLALARETKTNNEIKRLEQSLINLQQDIGQTILHYAKESSAFIDTVMNDLLNMKQELEIQLKASPKDEQRINELTEQYSHTIVCLAAALECTDIPLADAKNLFKLMNKSSNNLNEVNHTKVVADIIDNISRPTTLDKVNKNRQAALIVSIEDLDKRIALFKELLDMDLLNDKRGFTIVIDEKNDISGDSYLSSVLFASPNFKTAFRVKLLSEFSVDIKNQPWILHVLLNNSSPSQNDAKGNVPQYEADYNLSKTDLADMLKIDALRTDTDLVKEIFFHYSVKRKVFEQIIDIDKFRSNLSQEHYNEQLADIVSALLETSNDNDKDKILLKLIIDFAMTQHKVFLKIYDYLSKPATANITAYLKNHANAKTIVQMNKKIDISLLLTDSTDRVTLLQRILGKRPEKKAKNEAIPDIIDPISTQPDINQLITEDAVTNTVLIHPPIIKPSEKLKDEAKPEAIKQVPAIEHLIALKELALELFNKLSNAEQTRAFSAIMLDTLLTCRQTSIANLYPHYPLDSLKKIIEDKLKSKNIRDCTAILTIAKGNSDRKKLFEGLINQYILEAIQEFTSGNKNEKEKKQILLSKLRQFTDMPIIDSYINSDNRPIFESYNLAISSETFVPPPALR